MITMPNEATWKSNSSIQRSNPGCIISSSSSRPLADFIRKQAAGKINQHRLKERTDMQAGCFGTVRYPFANGKLQKNRKPEFRAPELSAWMELNCLWYVSRDKAQTAGLSQLLEIKF
jgi:hypothetical protein